MTLKTRVLLGSAAILVVLLVITPLVLPIWAAHRLEAAKQRCREAGMPMTFAEIVLPSIADADNAAPLFEKIATLEKEEAFAGPHGEHGVMEQLADFNDAHRGQSIDASAAGELAKLLGRPEVEAILALAREAAARKGCDGHVDYSAGPKVIFPLVGPQLDAVRLFAAHARVAASSHQAEVACKDLWVMFRLAEFPAREPSLINQLSRVAGETLAIDALEEVTQVGSVPDFWATKFSQHLLGLDLTRDLVRAMDGERLAFGSWVFEKFISGEIDLGKLASGSEPSAKAGALWRYHGNTLGRLEYAFYLDGMRTVRAELADTAQGEAAQTARLQKVFGNTPRYYLINRIACPMVSPIGRKFWQSRASVEVALAGLALERYRNRHLRYPDSLAALVPEFAKEKPRDLFTNRPLTYRYWDGGAVVYSFGPNLRDDGGVFVSTGEKDDRAWHCGISQPIFNPPH